MQEALHKTKIYELGTTEFLAKVFVRWLLASACLLQPECNGNNN
jgi:hypothetical protein